MSLYQAWLDQHRSACRQQRLETMAAINMARCDLMPMYGQDVHALLRGCVRGSRTNLATPTTVQARLNQLKDLLDRLDTLYL